MSIGKWLLSICLVMNVVFSQEIVDTYPTLPSQWVAETIEPGAPGSGKGIESYNFVANPTEYNPSAMWSNYTDCERLIYIPSTNNAKRYLLGCESVNCCWEPQDGNQVEFQIPNVKYSNPNKKVDVYWRNANVTNFGETFEADEWSWSWNVKDKLSQDWRAYTLPCEECVNGIKLIQWQSRAMGLEWWPVQFKNYRGIDPLTEEGEQFKSSFTIPDVCMKNNLLQCPSGLNNKYFSQKCCDTCPEGTDKYYSIPVLSKNHCGESCIKPEDYNKFKLLEPKLTKADTNTPCLDRGFIYEKTEEHAFGPIKIEVDLYKSHNLKSSDCGTCGTGYQACCIGFALDGYPCDCHLQDGGSGKAGADCGDCGTAYSACCIGYAADGYPCQCDVM
tara:strand:- start:2762 stop:3925 length:1164 start_codon:yes stop_codon:yes gene_type:complete